MYVKLLPNKLQKLMSSLKIAKNWGWNMSQQ